MPANTHDSGNSHFFSSAVSSRRIMIFYTISANFTVIVSFQLMHWKMHQRGTHQDFCIWTSSQWARTSQTWLLFFLFDSWLFLSWCCIHDCARFLTTQTLSWPPEDGQILCDNFRHNNRMMFRTIVQRIRKKLMSEALSTGWQTSKVTLSIRIVIWL